MQTKIEKLRALAEVRDPSLRMAKLLTDRAMAEAIGKMDMMKGDKGETGDDGYTPVKGKDYFTNEEIQSIINYIQSNVQPGEQGIPGTNGKDGRNGINGTSPDVDKLVKTILAKIPKAKDGVSPKIEDVVKQTITAINNNPDQEFVTVKQLTEFLRRGGFRGGAGSGSSTTQAVYSDTVAGTIDGVNQTFTVSTNINTAFSLYLANSVYQPVVDFTTSGTTITMVVAPDSSLSGQPFWLLHN